MHNFSICKRFGSTESAVAFRRTKSSVGWWLHFLEILSTRVLYHIKLKKVLIFVKNFLWFCNNILSFLYSSSCLFNCARKRQVKFIFYQPVVSHFVNATKRTSSWLSIHYFIILSLYGYSNLRADFSLRVALLIIDHNVIRHQYFNETRVSQVKCNWEHEGMGMESVFDAVPRFSERFLISQRFCSWNKRTKCLGII